MTPSGTVMLGSYDYGLVILSVLISILASFAALDLAGRVAAARGKAMLVWLMGGATASGIGTWSMHYTAMRAFLLPVPVRYDWPTVLLSLLPAVFGSAVALFVVSRTKVGLPRLLAGGVLVGGGIAVMHYTGMASMRLAGMCHYSPFSVTLSVVLTILFSLIALSLTFVHSDAKPGPGVPKAASVLLLGAANPIMHYSAMAGTTFMRSSVVPDLTHAVSMSTIGLQVFAIIPIMILTVAMATSLVDRLHKESAILDRLFEQAPQAVVLTDQDNRVLRVNSEFTRVFGYAAQDTIGRRLDDLIVPDEARGEFLKHMELLVTQGQRVDSEGIRRRKDGSRLHTSVIRVPVTLPGGQSAIYAILSDITERRRAEDALRHSEDHLRLVIDTVPALIHTGRPDGYLDYFNRRWLDYVGLSLEETSGWKWEAVNHPEDAAATVEKWRRSIGTGEPFEHESRLRRADGEYRWMLHRTVPLRDEPGNIVKWYGSSVDIEDRKRAEEALRRSEQLYSKLVNSVDCIVWEADARTFQFSFVSPQAERILGHPVAQWKSPDFWVERLHPDDRKWCTALCKQAAEEGRDHAFEYRMVAADGQTVWVHDVVSVQMGPDGPARLTGVMIDVTRRKLAEIAAKESGERFRLVFERSTAGMMIADASGKLIRANKAFCDFLGYSEDELRGRSTIDITHPEDAAKTLAYLQEAKQHKAPSYDLEKRYVRKGGEAVWGRANAVFLLPEGRPACWIAVVLDISERKRAEDDLRRQKEILQKIFDNAPVMIGFLAPDGKLSLANREWESTLGWSLEEMRAHDLGDLLAEFYPDPKLRQEAIEFMSSASPKFADLSVRVRDGQVIETSWGKVRLSDGTEIYIGRDITERKRAEGALRESEERYRNFISHSTEGVWRLELQRPLAVGLPEEESVAWLLQHGYIAECNDAFAQIIGFHSREEVEGKRFGDVLPAADEERIESFRSAARGGWQSRTIEFQGRDHAGNLKHLFRTEIPIVENGKLSRIWGITRDLTERKRAEEALRESEERLSLVTSQLPAIVWSADKEMRFTSHLGAGLRALGLESNQLVGKSVEEFVLSLGRQPDRPDPRRAQAGESLNYEVTLKGRDYDVHVEPLRNAAGEITGTVGIALDVTARRQAEVALRESEERFRTIFENAGVGMALVDLEGHPIKTNPALRQMVGYSEEEFSRMLFTEFTHPGDRQLDWRLYSELAAGKRDNYEIEKRYLKKGGGVVWGLLVVSLVKDRHGRPMYCVGMVEDITERKRTEVELQKSRDQLRALAARLQKVREEERTRVAREIHDELGQALTAIKIELSSLNHGMPAERKQHSESIMKLVDETIQSVRRISTDLRPAVLDALGLVAAVEWAAEEFETRTGIECQLDLPEHEVVIDHEHATALFRIFQETLTNVARHANATAVNIRLAKENGNLLLEVHDNGKGVNEEQLSAGVSLGILGMRERALLLGGELSITSAPGEGTTVRARIPDTRTVQAKGGV